MSLASVRHECRRTVRRRRIVTTTRRLPFTLPVLLVPLACGAPAAPAVGDAYRLDATARAVYDCAPGSAVPIDPVICGAREDTVDLDTHGQLQGRLLIVAIDTGDRRRQGTGGGGAGSLTRQTISVEGSLEETVCSPECATLSGSRRGYVDRLPTVCAPGSTLTACAGKTGDTVVTVHVWIEDMAEIFGLGLFGLEGADGRTEDEYVQFGELLPLGPPPRHGTRFHLVLVRERHFL